MFSSIIWLLSCSKSSPNQAIQFYRGMGSEVRKEEKQLPKAEIRRKIIIWGCFRPFLRCFLPFLASFWPKTPLLCPLCSIAENCRRIHQKYHQVEACQAWGMGLWIAKITNRNLMILGPYFSFLAQNRYFSRFCPFLRVFGYFQHFWSAWFLGWKLNYRTL